MMVSGQGPAMHAENLLRAVRLHPLPKWSHCTEAGSKRYINIIGQRNGGVAARLRDLEFGTYFPAG